MVKPEQFYRHKRVFVTGHTGFKGAWLCQWLISMGATVTGYSLSPEDADHNLYSLLNLSQNMHSKTGDIRDKDALQHAIAKAEPDIIFHLAAQSLVLPSYDTPLDTFSTNIMGTLNLLECARHARGLKAIVNVTTDKCYENNDSGAAFRETDPLGGQDPYSASKAAAEIVSAAYRNACLTKAGIHMATARAGNVIGGGDFAQHRLIPDIVRAAETGKPLQLRQPESIRPWQYVLDVLHGYLLLAQALFDQGASFAQAFNFASGDGSITTSELTAHFIQALEKNILVNHVESDRHEAGVLKLDAKKARATLNWRPIISTREALNLTAQWYKGYFADRSATASFTASQLASYTHRVKNVAW